MKSTIYRHGNVRVATAVSALGLLLAAPGWAASSEESNLCAGTQNDPCVRTGSCEIQGAVWTQVVTIDRSDIFDTQGWPGVCGMVHVALVQGNCEPSGGSTNVTANLSATSSAAIPAIEGPLSCAGEPVEPPGVPAATVVGRSGMVAALLAVYAWWGWAQRRPPGRATVKLQ
jgi:hypothetical protein